MADAARGLATYDDILASPPHSIAQIVDGELPYRQSDGAWVRLGAWAGAVAARIPPFDAVELELGALWVKKNPSL